VMEKGGSGRRTHGGREGGRDGWREGEREGWGRGRGGGGAEGAKEGGREGQREGEKEGADINSRNLHKRYQRPPYRGQSQHRGGRAKQCVVVEAKQRYGPHAGVV
jgi:hypothetical protein